MNAQIKPIPTLHDLALQAGAFNDKADPSIGVMQDHYVFTLEELIRFVEINAAIEKQRGGV